MKERIEFASLCTIPRDVLFVIFEYLEIEDLVRCRRLGRAWREAVDRSPSSQDLSLGKKVYEEKDEPSGGQYACDLVIQTDRARVLRWTWPWYRMESSVIFEVAAMYRSLRVMKCVMTLTGTMEPGQNRFRESGLDWGATELRWFIDQGIYGATRGGNMHLVRWFMDRDVYRNQHLPIDVACIDGNLALFVWMVNRAESSDIDLKTAITFWLDPDFCIGNHHIVDWWNKRKGSAPDPMSR